MVFRPRQRQIGLSVVYSVVTSVTPVSHHANLRRDRAIAVDTYPNLICFNYHRLFSLCLSLSLTLFLSLSVFSSPTSIHWRSSCVSQEIKAKREAESRLLFFPRHFRMHHQALKMKDGWRIKAIPKCQASAMATSEAESSVVVNVCRCAPSTPPLSPVSALFLLVVAPRNRDASLPRLHSTLSRVRIHAAAIPTQSIDNTTRESRVL